jgi:hypothetical protein
VCLLRKLTCYETFHIPSDFTEEANKVVTLYTCIGKCLSGNSAVPLAILIVVMAILNFSVVIFLEELRKTKENSPDSRSAGRDLNPGTSDTKQETYALNCDLQCDIDDDDDDDEGTDKEDDL